MKKAPGNWQDTKALACAQPSAVIGRTEAFGFLLTPADAKKTDWAVHVATVQQW